MMTVHAGCKDTTPPEVFGSWVEGLWDLHLVLPDHDRWLAKRLDASRACTSGPATDLISDVFDLVAAWIHRHVQFPT